MAHGINCEEELVQSISDEAALNALVVHGVLPDRATIGWRPAFGEEFPTPRTDELSSKITSTESLVFPFIPFFMG